MRLLPALLLLGCSLGEGTEAVPAELPAPVGPADPVVAAAAPAPAPEEIDPVEAIGFQDPETCRACHPSQVAEWEQSMHAYAALSPVFDAMAAKAWRDTAGEVGTFCTACHTPLGALAGEEGWTTAETRSPLSRKGVSCDACHTVLDHDGPIGNNNLVRDAASPKLGPFAEPVSGEVSGGHMAKHSELITSPHLCGGCHDVFMEPGLDIEEAYSEHLSSPAYAEGIRCQDCHMGPEPGVPAIREEGPAAVVDGVALPDRELSSHRFVGPDVALIDGFPYPDDLEASAKAQAEYKLQVQTLLENAVELKGLAQDEPLPDKHVLQVLVVSKTSGHRVPTGFTSERQLWVDLTVTGPDGTVLLRSGQLDGNGDLLDHHSAEVASGALEADEALVNFQSTNTAVSRHYSPSGGINSEFGAPTQPGGSDKSTTAIFPFDAVSINRNSLEPLEARTVTYDLEEPLPEGSKVEVALRYRAMPPYVLRALQLEELTERVPVFTIDTLEETL